MGLSIFARLLITERFRTRASSGAGFAIPHLYEFELADGSEPLLATNAKGSFLPTRRSRDGVARCGFSEVPLEEETNLLRKLHAVLLQTSHEYGWPQRCASVPEAVEAIEAVGGRPCSVVVPFGSALEVCGVSDADAKERMRTAGVVTRVGKTQVLAVPFEQGDALVADTPSSFGVYVRVEDRLGLLLKSLHRTVVVVHGVGR